MGTLLLWRVDCFALCGSWSCDPLARIKLTHHKTLGRARQLNRLVEREAVQRIVEKPEAPGRGVIHQGDEFGVILHAYILGHCYLCCMRSEMWPPFWRLHNDPGAAPEGLFE